jgi:hypothetical protein
MKFVTADNPHTRCYYDPEDEDAGFVDLRTLTMEKSKKIAKATTRRRIEYKRGRRHEIEDVDDKKREQMTWSYCIGEWGGTLDRNGTPIENTDENKVMLMNKSNQFANFVSVNLEKISEAEEEFKEAEAKN